MACPLAVGQPSRNSDIAHVSSERAIYDFAVRSRLFDGFAPSFPVSFVTGNSLCADRVKKLKVSCYG